MMAVTAPEDSPVVVDAAATLGLEPTAITWHACIVHGSCPLDPEWDEQVAHASRVLTRKDVCVWPPH